MREQQTGLFDARGLQKLIVRPISGHLLGMAIPELTTWRQLTEPATKAIEQLEGMHQLLVLWGLGLSLASGEHSWQSRLAYETPRALF